MIEQDTQRLRELAAKLYPNRNDSGLFADMYEAADDWRSMGEMLCQNNPWEDFSGLAQQNDDQMNELRAMYGDQIAANPDFREIMALGTRVTAEGRARIPGSCPGTWCRSCG